MKVAGATCLYKKGQLKQNLNQPELKPNTTTISTKTKKIPNFFKKY